jgi:hypothetical protein
MNKPQILSAFAALLLCPLVASGQSQPEPAHAIVLHAARLLDIESGHIVTPGEVLVQGERIVEAGARVTRPAGAEIIDLGDTTLLPGLIDAHVHLFLHPGAEDLQTVQESVPQRRLSPRSPPATTSWPDSPPSVTWAPKAQAQPIPPCATPSIKV